jgi:hypothetical protein
MPGLFTDAVEKALKGFDPEGAGYDEVTAEELRRLAPLPAMSKPARPGRKDYEEVVYTDPKTGETSFEAWVWHPQTEKEEGGWYAHGSSRDPRTGMLLKGRKHETWDKLVAGEAASNNVIYKDPKTGRYFSAHKQPAQPTRKKIFKGEDK